jgi:hypothetical protein
VVVLRYLLDFTGPSLVSGAVSPDATRTDPAAIAAYLGGCAATMLDVDLDGGATAETDGVLISRFLFGFTGPALVLDALGTGCMRCEAGDIESHLASFLPGP